MSEPSYGSQEHFNPDFDANAVWTVRFLEPAGFEVQLSIEASSGTEALKKGQLVIERLKEMQCSPKLYSHPISIVPEQENNNESICPIHHCKMRLWQKDNRSWYSHKVDGHWCKGGKT